MMISLFNGFLLQACGYAEINQGGWVSINLIVILLSITIAAMVYMVSKFMPGQRREKLTGLANYEILQVFFSAVLIVVLIGLAFSACQAGSLLVGYPSYTDLFSAVNAYIANLLFINGLNFVTKIYTVSIQYNIIGNLAFFLLNQGLDLLQGLKQLSALSGVITLSFSNNIDSFFIAYSGLYTATYGTLIAISFGGLFILLLTLPIIKAGALAVVLPVTIIFRSLAFAGPGLRKVANTLLAMAIGLYFVLPLTIAFDSYVASCLNIGLSISQVACTSYPFTSYLSGYSVNALSPSLFTVSCPPPPVKCVANSQNIPSFAGALTLPTTFYSTAVTSNLDQFLTIMYDAPIVAADYGKTVAAYLFVSIVLVAIDMAITIGLIAGLAKGLDAFSNLFSPGSFWGN